MSQVLRTPKSYDVCIVGSGAGGGMAAKILTEGGLNVVLLEAGPPVNPEKDFKMFMWPYDLPHRGVGVGGHAADNFGEFLAPNGAWNIDGEPYTSAPEANFQWFRSRIVGGRTNHWGRIALRFAPIDFTSGTRDGLGDDWPITYQDIAPYYDKVESYIGVFGTKENVSSAPDGMFLPPPRPRCTELLVKKACDKLNIICIPARLAILTRSINGRQPCHYCGQCGRGCVTASNFSSSQVLFPPAMKTGKLTLITGAMARAVIVGKDGKAEGVSYVDKATRTENRVNARAVDPRRQRLRIGAPAAEFALPCVPRWTRQFLRHRRQIPHRLRRQRWLGATSGTRKNARRTITTASAACTCTSRGGNSTARMIFLAAITSKSAAAGTCPASECSTSYATTKKAMAPRSKPARARLTALPSDSRGRGEMLPNPHTYCEIDPDVVDQWGIPVLRFHFRWSEYELRQAQDMQETFRSIIETMGGVYKTKTAIDGQYPFGILEGGKIIHEVGTARMGADPKTSVLNGYCQAHDVKNLFVTDGASLVTNPDKNPTLTIMALSWRASEYLLDEARKGNICMSAGISRRDILKTLASPPRAAPCCRSFPRKPPNTPIRPCTKKKPPPLPANTRQNISLPISTKRSLRFAKRLSPKTKNPAAPLKPARRNSSTCSPAKTKNISSNSVVASSGSTAYAPTATALPIWTAPRNRKIGPRLIAFRKNAKTDPSLSQGIVLSSPLFAA